jgi:cell division control protein 7
MMAMAKSFSDHLSNPLQATPSDPTNNVYNHMYLEAKQRPMVVVSSDDELGVWAAKERYQQQVKSVTNAVQDRLKQFSTPKYVDLDKDMSDDELAHPFHENTIKKIGFRNIEIEEAFLRFEDARVEESRGQQLGDDEATSEQDHVIMDEPEEDDCPFEDDEMSFKNEPLNEPLPYTPQSPFSSPQSSRPPSPDESKTLSSRSAEEQAEIQHEMNALDKAVPQLRGQYQLLDRLGTGTFSSVYKAIDLLYDDWDNRPWLGNHPPESTAYYQSAGPTYKGRGGRGPKRRSTNASGDVDIDMEPEGTMYVAVKRIYTTSGPDRIKNELSILETCRGCRHTSQIITAFRHHDQVVIVLPYQRNMDFRVRGHGPVY